MNILDDVGPIWTISLINHKSTHEPSNPSTTCLMLHYTPNKQTPEDTNILLKGSQNVSSCVQVLLSTHKDQTGHLRILIFLFFFQNKTQLLDLPGTEIQIRYASYICLYYVSFALKIMCFKNVFKNEKKSNLLQNAWNGQTIGQKCILYLFL